MVLTAAPGEPGGPASDDRGSVLILTLVLTVVLAAIVLSLATYATAGLVSSHVTTDRIAATTAASAAVQWEIEEFTHKRATPCTSTHDVSMPGGVGAGVDAVSLRCVAVADVDGHPAALLEARATSGRGAVAVAALVQVPRTQYVTHVLRWSVD